MNTAGYKTGTKMTLPKAPFTPVNAPGPNGAYQNSNQTQNHSTQQQAGGGNQRQHMYMSQPQVATVLSHQQPPPPPGQGAQSGQSGAPSRGVPPPPPQPGQAQAGFNPQQSFVPAADNMHGYAQGRPMPFAAAAAAAAAGPSHFYPGYYLSNQGHPAMSYDSAQQAYLAQNAQAMFPPPAPFIYQQWMPHMRAQNPPAAPQAAPSSAQSAQPAPAEPLVYPGASLIPPIQQQMQYPYQPTYAAANPSQPSAQASQPYQKREKKPLLIVDPNTKKPINQQEQQQQQPQSTAPSVAHSKPDASSSVMVETAKKENIANIVEDKKIVDTAYISERSGEDFQTQMIRKMKDQQQQQQQQQQSGSGSGPAGVVAEESVSVANKPSSKQVTVSVSQAHAPVPAAAAVEPEPKSEPVKIEQESGAAKQEQQQEQQQEPEKEEEGKAEAEPQKKRRYDREFLMSLKDSELSKQIPEHLKELDVFKDLRVKPGQQYFGKSSYGGGGGGGGQEQQYGKGSMSKNKSQKFGSMNKYHRGSMEGGRQQAADMDMPRPQPIKKAATEHEELLRDVRNILNKLTPQNLQKLTGDLLNLPINTEDRLKDSIHVIFEKSLDEQVFSQTYAELCKQMCRITVPIESDTTKLVNFRTMLLTKCQQEFENDYVQNVNYETLIAEAEAQPDEAKRAELKELAAEKLTKAKRRSLGNIRFIGELFKLKMLTEGIMNDCIDRLLKQDTDEENLECLCKLLTTIGKELDKANNAQRIKAYFDKLDKISKRKEAISARIRFMIMDVIDLRKNEWVPRRKDTGPRKIDDIRREAQEEKARLEAAQQQQMQQQAHGRQKGKYVAKSTSMGSSSAGKAHNGSMASKIKDVRQITNRNSNELTLGPGGSSSYSWGKQRSAAVAQPSSAEHNIPQSASFSVQKRVAEPVARASLDSRAVKDRLQAVKRMDSASDSSQPSSRDSSLTRPLKKTYTDDEIDRKTNSFINELVQNKIMAESIKDLEEFCPLNTEQYADFVEKCIMVTLEKNHTWRTLLGQFFYIALRDKKLDQTRFEQGLKRVIEISEDMSIDIPKISTYLGQIIAPLFNENFSMSFLKQALEPVLEIKISAEIVAEALTLASERLGHSTVSGIFKASNLQLDDFLRGVDQKQHFISENKLDWLNDPNCDKPQSNTSVESYETILNQILPSVEEDTSIFGKIEAKFQDCRSKMFIRALVIAVCNSCYNGKFDSDLFKTQCFILRRYIGENEDLEFEALFAVQALDHRLQHQPGFIRVIFDLLYDEDLIREDVFLKWKNEGREEGHAISVLALKQFFEWLADPENENQEGANENR